MCTLGDGEHTDQAWSASLKIETKAMTRVQVHELEDK